MRRSQPTLLLLAALSACAAPVAQQPATVATPAGPPRARILDVTAVPLPSPAARPIYERFLTFPAPRAFAIGDAGGIGWTAGAATTEEAVERALAGCRNANRGRPCRLYARDQAVVWHGEDTAGSVAPSGTAGTGWSLNIATGTLVHGETAKGALLWTHGRGGSADTSHAVAPQPFVQRFNNAGYDVWLLLRDPIADRHHGRIASFADRALREAARWLRAQGYASVIAAGQSAGGWAALAALDTPGLLDGVIAIAGAGYYVSPTGRRDLLDFEGLVAAVRERDAPIAAVLFADDPLLPMPEQSAAALRRGLAWRDGPLLVLDRPPGLHGHGAGATALFNDRYGECLLRFISERDPSACPR